MALTIGAVVVRVRDLPRMAEFWRAALDYVDREPPEATWVSLRPRAGAGVHLSLDLRGSGYALPLRLHLDLSTADRPAEVERLVGLGARVVPLEHRQQVDWTLLEDPEGNRFDVADLPRVSA